MTSRRILLAVLTLVVVIMVAAREYRPAGELVDAPVLTAAAAVRDFAIEVDAVGALEAVRATLVSSRLKAEGTIIALVADGARVAAGDPLIELDPTPFERRVEELAASVRELAAKVAVHEQALAWEQSRAAAEVASAGFDVSAAELELEQVREGDGPIELAKLERAAAEGAEVRDKLMAYLTDLADLERRGYTNPAEIEQAARQVEAAKRGHTAAVEQLERYRDHVLPAALEKVRARVQRSRIERDDVQRTVVFQVAKAEAALSQAREQLATTEATLTIARSELDDTVIRAPIPGMAVLRAGFYGGESRKPRVGDSVLRGQPLVYLPDVSSMQAHIRVRELDLHKVAVGMAATVRVDAFPDLELAARVASIGVLAEGQNSGLDKFFEVVVAIAGSDDRLRPGMTAPVTVHSATIAAVLTVPVQAVFTDRTGGSNTGFAGSAGARNGYVFVDRGDAFERRAVEQGRVGDQWAEVRDGLAPGEHVALSQPPPAAILGSRRDDAISR